MQWDHDTSIELPFTSACYGKTRLGFLKPSAFTCSAALHAGLVIGLALMFNNADESDAPPAPHYSIRLLKMSTPEVRSVAVTRPLMAPARGGAPNEAGRKGSPRESVLRDSGAGPTGVDTPESAPEPAAPKAARIFELPHVPEIQKTQQTILQLDIPNNIVIKQNIPLPAAIIWAQTHVRRPRPQEFVAPPPRELVKPVVSLPAAPTLQPANGESRVADLKISAVPVEKAALLIRPPSTTSPVRIPGADESNSIPETTRKQPTEASEGNLVSLPAVPLASAQIIAVPPANQIANSSNGTSMNGGAAGDGSMGENHSTASGSSSGGSGTSGRAREDGAGRGASSTGKGFGTGQSIAGGSGEQSTGIGAGNGSGSRSLGPGNGGSVAGSVGSGGDPTGISIPTSGPVIVRGVPAIRVVRPKDGRYNVVLLGSSAGDAYPESEGILSGKLVYTVYVQVGLKKKWILQYCVPRETQQKTTIAKGSTTQLDAPWPFVLFRPDAVAGLDADYVMVHGILNLSGKFEGLKLVIPDTFKGKDLLLTLLGEWEFRPANRDGVPTAVEVLLIIPRETA